MWSGKQPQDRSLPCCIDVKRPISHDRACPESTPAGQPCVLEATQPSDCSLVAKVKSAEELAQASLVRGGPVQVSCTARASMHTATPSQLCEGLLKLATTCQAPVYQGGPTAENIEGGGKVGHQPRLPDQGHSRRLTGAGSSNAFHLLRFCLCARIKAKNNMGSTPKT